MSNRIRRQLRFERIGSTMGGERPKRGPVMRFLKRAGCRAAAAGVAVAVCMSPIWGQEVPKPPNDPRPPITATSPTATPIATTTQKLSHVPVKYDVSKIGSRNVGGGMNF